MAKLQDLGFSDFFEEDGLERGAAIVAELSEQQVEALQTLEAYRREYFKDLREFARRKIDAAMRDVVYRDNVSDEDFQAVVLDLANSTAHLAISMSDKFQLLLMEIIQFGERRGELPEMETARILE